MTPSLAERLDALYAGFTWSPTYRRVYRQVYGDEYPEEAEPFGAATRSDLQHIAEVVGVGPGQVLLDLGVVLVVQVCSWPSATARSWSGWTSRLSPFVRRSSAPPAGD